MRALADAVLYEGYLLYPYRRSSPKNRVRWQFGVLAPPGWVEAHGPPEESVAGSVEAAWQQSEVLSLAGASSARLRLWVRFLQVQHKQIEAGDDHAGYEPVEALEAGEAVHLGFDEAVPQELELDLAFADLLAGEAELPIVVPGAELVEPVTVDGRVVGRIRRRRAPIHGRVQVRAERRAGPGPEQLVRICVRVANVDKGIPASATRDEALRRSLVATHQVIRIEGGRFLSLLDPPQWAEPEAAACRNVHTFPVLAAPAGCDELVLSSPIILYDHPQIAPESPGDLFDATEIDEILTLRTLTLTEAEKREARATDPRAAAVLDRVEAMPDEVLGRLHGAVRSLRAVGRQVVAGRQASGAPEASAAPEVAGAPGLAADPFLAGEASEEDPGGSAVSIGGHEVARGAKVLLRPRLRGTDPQDRFLDGRQASVQGVFLDVEGNWHVAVTLDDDPFAEICGATSRFRYFAPEEIEPLGGAR